MTSKDNPKVVVDNILDKIDEMINLSEIGIVKLDYVTLTFVKEEIVKIRDELYAK